MYEALVEQVDLNSLVMGVRVIRIDLDGAVEALDRLLFLKIVLQNPTLNMDRKIRHRHTGR